MIRLLRSLFILVLCLCALAAGLWWDAGQLMQAPLQLQSKQRFEIGSGKNLNGVLMALRAQEVVPADRLVRYVQIYARITGKASLLKAGEYELTPGMNSYDLLALMISGKTVLHELRLTEGWTFNEARAAIAGSPELVHTLKDLDEQQVMAALDQPGLRAEGRFFPDTYRFPKGTTDAAFLRRAFSEMSRHLQQEWTQRDPDLPYRSADEALIMASIIEKETAVPDERAEVAGVFIRRLKLGMKLQTDPTVIYGLGPQYDGSLHRRDLDTDTQYNTYTRTGLPPTPICLPGRASLHAALHPATGSALFFVARGDGTHQFSDTLDQHNAAVKKFQLGKNQ